MAQGSRWDDGDEGLGRAVDAVDVDDLGGVAWVAKGVGACRAGLGAAVGVWPGEGLVGWCMRVCARAYAHAGARALVGIVGKEGFTGA